MIKYLLELIAIVLSINVMGQEPESFKYQTIVRTITGEIVSERTVSIQIYILKGSPSGDVVYSEKHEEKTSLSGLISISIGNGTSKTGELESINWTSDSFFLKVATDTAGGISLAEMGTTQMLVVSEGLRQKRVKNASPIIEEDELVIMRKFVGRFLDYRYTDPETNGGPGFIWIKTSLESIYGKISAYGKKCKFSVGDNLYIKRSFYTPGGISGYWIYQIENDSSAYYRVTDFQHDKKVLTETWFQ